MFFVIMTSGSSIAIEVVVGDEVDAAIAAADIMLADPAIEAWVA